MTPPRAPMARPGARLRPPTSVVPTPPWSPPGNMRRRTGDGRRSHSPTPPLRRSATPKTSPRRITIPIHIRVSKVLAWPTRWFTARPPCTNPRRSLQISTPPPRAKVCRRGSSIKDLCLRHLGISRYAVTRY
jgi:hypothetical protein